MELKNHWFTANRGAIKQLLQWVNLRPEEVERTWMMFGFYTTVSVGLRWAEDSTVAMFLDEYGAGQLPWIYIASAGIGTGLVVLYSWLQKIFPLRWVIVAIAPCMATPLFLLVLLRGGVHIPYLTFIVVFLLRLWVDAFYVVNDINTSIVANQLFNIREIKRAYPLVSSGLLVADVISGFSLSWLVQFAKLDKVLLISCIVIIFGSAILFYLTYNYRKAFPDTPQRLSGDDQSSRHRRLQTPLKRYAFQLFAFVAMLQVIGLLIDFQYLRELNSNLGNQDLAGFLGLFGGIVGLCELLTQWFISSRLIERVGVFFTAGLLPITVGFIVPGAIALSHFIPGFQERSFFWGLIGLKFCDELLRYTFVISSGPALYQPIPERIRSWMQTLSGGTADAIASGFTGLLIFATLIVSGKFLPPPMQKWVFLVETVIVAATCLKVVWQLRSRYVDLLVLSAERGELSAANVGLRVFKQGVVKALAEKGSEADKRSCLELLAQIDPQGAAQILAPLLIKLPTDLQCHSLEIMLLSGANPLYVPDVRLILEQPPGKIDPEVFALALRYVWLADANPDLVRLEAYLHIQHHPLVRATAAALLLRQGTPLQRVAATKTMNLMLMHRDERERINAVKALREAAYLQELRRHIPNLLQDKSLRVRCTVLEMIAATRLEEYYSALLAALNYKSTRPTAMRCLVKLENDGLQLLLQLATNIYKPEIVRMYAWRTIAQIGTVEARESLWSHLETSWGSARDNILRSLLKINQPSEATKIVDRFYENKVEFLIEQELKFLGEIYAAYIDFQKLDYRHYHQSERLLTITHLLLQSLLELEIDVKNRLLLLLKLLYPQSRIQAAAMNLRSQSVVSFARGLEILDHTINLSCKPLLLNILDRRSEAEKLKYLIEAGIIEVEETIMSDRTERNSISDRLSQLIILGNLLSDWCLACCFHFAQVAHIPLSTAEILVSLRHPTGFVREAAISYLNAVSQSILLEILPNLQKDPHPLVAAQVKELVKKFLHQPIKFSNDSDKAYSLDR
jgi:hypothetical protein